MLLHDIVLSTKLNENFCTVNVFRLKSLRFIDRYRKCQRRRLTRRLGANGGSSEVANNHFPLEKDREIINVRECCEGRESGIYFIISSFRIAVIVRGSAY